MSPVSAKPSLHFNPIREVVLSLPTNFTLLGTEREPTVCWCRPPSGQSGAGPLPWTSSGWSRRTPGRATHSSLWAGEFCQVDQNLILTSGYLQHFRY